MFTRQGGLDIDLLIALNQILWKPDMNADRYFMEMALDEAKQAFSAGEFPVGCVIADGHFVLARGSRKGSAGDHPNEIDHAEISAIRQLFEKGRPSAVEKLSLYSTMEPCLMCFAAIVLAGIGRIVYAYEDVMGGGTGCRLDVLPKLYRESRMTIVSHVMRRESLALFKAFFSNPQNVYWKDSLLSDYTLAQE
jgi:tRNA(adenine34) deaminase